VLAKLVEVTSPRNPEAVVLVLHGGAGRGDVVHVSPTQPSVLRMIPTARRVARAGRGRLAVLRLLNSYRGWDARQTPVADVTWAIREVTERYGATSVGLVGHSLGGRAALLSAARPEVASVVALNAWLSPADRPVATTARVLVVHGLRDRIAPAARSAAYVEGLGRGVHASYLALPEGKHAMLRGGADFDRYAAEFTAGALLDPAPSCSGPVLSALAGDRCVHP
jgi:pimeloyl-ACP methyl ester carboxylesterase